MSAQVKFYVVKEVWVKVQVNRLDQLPVNVFSMFQINNIYKQNVIKDFIYNSIIGNSNTITVPAL